MSIPQEMNAVTIDRFGGVDVLAYTRQPVPQVGADEVLVKVAYAGVGTWDPLEREGGFVELTGETPSFPLTLGSDGAGTIAAVGTSVQGFVEGDEVYALGGGFYAEYVVLDANRVSQLPTGVALDEGGAMPVVALTAYHGLVSALGMTSGETLLVNGASGDVGHVAVQLAKFLGVRVLAVASGHDGVSAAYELGADVAIDGRTTDIAAAARGFAPSGLDAVLSLVGGSSLNAALSAVHVGGRVAFPLGIDPEPEPREGIRIDSFDITLDVPATTKARMTKLNALIVDRSLRVKVSTVFSLDQAGAAHEALGQHRVGKILLTPLTQNRNN